MLKPTFIHGLAALFALPALLSVACTGPAVDDEATDGGTPLGQTASTSDGGAEDPAPDANHDDVDYGDAGYIDNHVDVDTTGIHFDTSVVGSYGWVLGNEDQFALVDEEPGECSPGGYYVESGVFEVDTGECNHATFVQPAAAEVTAGELLRFDFWHLVLIPNEESGGDVEGHVALFMNGVLAYEMEVPIPAPELVYQPVIAAPVDVAEGDEIVLHVHNHGYNSWRFAGLTRAEREEPSR